MEGVGVSPHASHDRVRDRTTTMTKPGIAPLPGQCPREIFVFCDYLSCIVSPTTELRPIALYLFDPPCASVPR